MFENDIIRIPVYYSHLIKQASSQRMCCCRLHCEWKLFFPTYLHKWLTQRFWDDTDSMSGHVRILNNFLCTQVHEGFHMAHSGSEVSWCGMKVNGIHGTSVVTIPQGRRTGHYDERVSGVKTSQTVPCSVMGAVTGKIHA